MRVVTSCPAFLLISALLGGTETLARTFEVGEVEGSANVELSYGLLVRVEDRDPGLVAIANGGEATSANWDDGDLNYDEGIVSNMVYANVTETLAVEAFYQLWCSAPRLEVSRSPRSPDPESPADA